ncbi:MAG: DUF1330 domain-containing protein [Alphaproteobacteria bacterium]|nr:DUF1330 domain-containing protein [Alphaproteobacteria bacterium]
MSAYVISFSSQHGDDPSWRDQYYKLVVPLLEKHGGKIIAAGAPAALERAPTWQRGALIEFPDEASARAFHEDPAYHHAKGLRIFHTDGEVHLLTAGS